jgi:protein-L-isoaspartate(D-aspartate) O-methyltransferase
MIATSLTPDAAGLRAAMVAKLQEDDHIRSAEVAAAFAAVPRELFAPGVELEAVYRSHDTVITKRDPVGKAASSISAPWLQAQMIEQARIRPGDRVLEVGSGGYNAALLAELAGPAGAVVTVDIDPWVTERAARFLTQAGYGNVQVIAGDGENAADQHGPFDVIVVTAGSWDCPWAKLLAEGGRLVVPLIVATYTRSVTFTRHGDRWDGDNPIVCGFIASTGACTGYQQQVTLAGKVHLAVEGGPALRQDGLSEALAGSRAEAWTAVTLEDFTGFFTLNLYLATTEDRAGMIWQEDGSDLAKPAARWFTPALIEADSFAYLTSRRVSNARDERFSELGVHAHGPNAGDLARQLAGRVREWDHGPRNQHGPVYTLYPAGIPVPAPPAGKTFLRRHVQITLAWP